MCFVFLLIFKLYGNKNLSLELNVALCLCRSQKTLPISKYALNIWGGVEEHIIEN